MLQVLQSRYEIENDDLWRAATGLGSGFSRRQTVCGAVSGGILAIGLVLGRQRFPAREERTQLRNETYACSQELMRRFEARFGDLECGAILGCDLSSADGRRQFEEQGLRQSVCEPAVRLAVETVADLCG